MLWYIAFVSVVNLGLGYALAVYLGDGRRYRRLEADPLPTWDGAVDAAIPRPSNVAAEPTAMTAEDAATSDECGFAGDVEPRAVATNVTPIADYGLAQPAAAPRAAESPVLDPVTQLATREYAEQRLADLSAGGAAAACASAALVEMNWAGQADDDTRERLLCGVTGAIRQLIDDGDTAAFFTDRQILLVLPDRNTDQATRCMEQLRQRVEMTKFVADGAAWPMTLTCALANVVSNEPLPVLLDMLDEALAEANRYGGNRTFLHDGLSSAPVVPLDLGLLVEQCAI